ncbi:MULTISPECIES: pyridoxal-dependent decarboxylase [unclassified Bradyrhizobium]|uniref:pyridoxal phosphate-dependent decarboxylase family protein n=1 Tax=unclassified Bradyrhizobium TaxID=2631580 RepID=UPI0020B2F68E|nr:MULTISPECIES: pyridoxal-dependent decarboxylase [unclassified Bradyrhizobium]MCP3402865.1 pyridoxal-dependent decarboxylase [Bradyrhizobium sp. CCGB20]MCP3411343.1 pyridoxal-dependent decarboxylase [Bradyrhizobium sp. CCGB01]
MSQLDWDAFCRSEFLLPNEANFPKLEDKLRFLIARLRATAGGRSGRRPVAPTGMYKEENVGFEIPGGTSSFEEAMSDTCQYFDGCIRWHDPRALFNITPSPLLDTVALAAITSLYNPNGLWDHTSGKLLLAERRVVSALAGLARWDARLAGGVFTSGGKATLMYGIKAGLNKTEPEGVAKGYRTRHRVLASATAHFSLESICNFLGLGKEATIRVQTDARGGMDLASLEQTMTELLASGDVVSAVIVSGGATMNVVADDFDGARRVIDRVCARADVPLPQLHADLVISWPWLMFDSESTIPRYLSPATVQRIMELHRRVAAVRVADSFGVDFHKTGLCPYSSSVFMAHDAASLRSMDSAIRDQTKECDFGDASNFDRTLENSRTCQGIITAYHVLRRLGKGGFREYIGRALRAREVFVEELAPLEDLELVNTDTLGFEVIVRPDFYRKTPEFRDIDATPESSEALLYKDRCEQFWSFLNQNEFNVENDTPVVGYVPRFVDHRYRSGAPAFLLYPVSVHLDRMCIRDVLRSLRNAKTHFERRLINGTEFARPRMRLDPPK